MNRNTDLAYNLFMAEQEGCLPPNCQDPMFYNIKHYDKVSQLLADICKRSLFGQTELTLTDEYLNQFGLSLDDLTKQDFVRLAKVAQKLP